MYEGGGGVIYCHTAAIKINSCPDGGEGVGLRGAPVPYPPVYVKSRPTENPAALAHPASFIAYCRQDPRL